MTTVNKTKLEDVKEYILYGGSYDFKARPVNLNDIILIDDNAYILNVTKAFIEEMQMRDVLKQYKLIATRTLFMGGAPGLGKTYLAKCISTMLQQPLYIVDIAGVMKNNGLDAVTKIMDFVRDPANQPCILFLDECDGLARSREDKVTTSADKTGDNRITNYIMQVLQEENDNIDSKLIVIAATNYMEGIDEAFLNRFQIQMTFKVPNNYIPFIELEIKKNNMFKLEKDIDESITKIINTYANRNGYSIRALNAKINYLYKQEVMRRKKEGTLDGSVIPIQLSSIMQLIANDCKLAINIKALMEEERKENETFEKLVGA